MPYPIITPAYFDEMTDTSLPESEDVVYNVLITPAAVEYIFPLNQERIIKKLMDTPDVLTYKMRTLKPELEEEYSAQGKSLIKDSPVLEHYWALKTLTMSILQNRNYIFEKRMLLLNFAYKTVQSMIEQSREDMIPGFINSFASQPKHDDVMKYFESIQPNFAFSLSDALSFIRSTPRSEEWDKIVDDVFKSVGVSREMTEKTFDKDHYLRMKKAYYEDFLKGKEHYIEQVMVNYVWTYCLPYADPRVNLWDNFIFFNILFNVIKVLLTCYTYEKEDKDAAFIKAIKEFDTSLRAANGNIVKHIVEVNAKDGLNNNGDMAILAMS